MTTEIPPRSWRPFCEKLNAQDGTRMDIRQQSDGDMRMVAQDVLLQSALLEEAADACNNILTFEFGLPDARPEQHRVVEPIRMILRRQSNGEHYNLLEILAENGTTVINFRPGISRALLNELKIPLPA